MTAERWELVKSLFEQALAVDRGQRDTFLDKQCGPDAELRQEVASLLASSDESAGFLEQPMLNVKAMLDIPAPASSSATGSRVGAYELVREIGQGGMGAVYLAVRADTGFEQHVAIKLIRSGMETEFLVRRFRKERQILARLEHPNIARLIDAGATVDGFPYFVMEYVEGEPLNRYCESRSLSLRERLRIFEQICSAVHYAHRRMIVHRDLKPGNILVRNDGTPKLLDFGIAKLLDPNTAEATESTIGTLKIVTPAYASPEQMRGEPATVGSDVYALGILLFEILTGRRPSAAPGEDPLPLPETEFNQSTGALGIALRSIVDKAVQSDPSQRYESVAEIIGEVRSALAGGPRQNPVGAPATTLARPAPGSVAVLPFRMTTTAAASDGFLGLGITDALIAKLGNVGRITVRSTNAVLKYATSVEAAGAGRELGVEFVLEGRVQRFDDRVRLAVQLVHVETNAPVWAGTFDEEFQDLLRVEESIAGQVAEALVPQLTGEEREKLVRPATKNAKAHEAYLRGRWHWSRGTDDSLPQALLSFMQAAAEDPDYALAHAGVADYYVQLGIRGGLPPAESFAAAKASAETALRIDPALAEAHASLGFVAWAYDRDYPAAAHYFQLAITLNPEYAPAHHWLGLLKSSRGRHEVAIECVNRARKLDPARAVYVADLARCHYNARRYQDAIDICLQAIRELGQSRELCLVLALSLRFVGELDKAMVAANRAVELAADDVRPWSVLAGVEAARGNRSRAEALLQQVKERSGTGYVSGCALAQLYLAAGAREEALAELDRAWRERDWWVTWLEVGSTWDELRGDVRFTRLAPPRTVTAPVAVPVVAAPVTAPKLARRRWWVAVAALAGLAIAGTLAYEVSKPRPIPFERTAITKLTTNGAALSGAISPDARRVVYTEAQAGGLAVWVRDLRGSLAQRVAGPFAGEIRSIEFIRDGKYVSFLVFPANEPARGVLYAAPVAGGVLETILPAGIPGPAGVSRDGSRIAFYRRNPGLASDDVVVRSVGADERVVASRHYSERFSRHSAPVWSPNGKHLVLTVEGSDAAGFRAGLILAGLDGSVRPVESPRWQWVGRVAWMKNGTGLVVLAQEPDSSLHRIWYVPLGRGQARRITDGLDDFNSLSVADDDSVIASVERQTLTNVYVLQAGDVSHGTQATFGSGRYFDVAWAPDGRIVYSSDAAGSAGIWVMDADGRNARQLTGGTGQAYAPAVSPDGHRLAFESNRDGNWNIWSMEVGTGQLSQLTTGREESKGPRFSADGGYVFYQHTGGNATCGIWKIRATGGGQAEVTKGEALGADISRKDGRIASWYSAGVAHPVWKIAIFRATGGEPLRTFDVPVTVVPGTVLRWTPEGDGVTYLDNRGGIGNIWVQPADGKPAHPLTSFDWGQVFGFDWSRDGRLVYSRGMSTNDVVLIRDLARSSARGTDHP